MENNLKTVRCSNCNKFFTTRVEFGELTICPYCNKPVIISNIYK